MAIKDKIAGFRFLRKSRGTPGKKNGFSLIEVLVAVFLMGIAVMGLAQIYTLAVLNNNRADRMATSTFLAQQRIDFLRALVTEELTSLALLDGTPIPMDEQLDLNNDGTLDYRRITQVQHTGFYWDVRVAVFPGPLAGESPATLLQDPMKYKVMADISTVISR
jgi:prepilin-type N-terminal cleavage/methylation domain-containing protein